MSDDEPHDIRYFDGLGRLSQRVLYKASPDTSKSIVSLIEYYNLSSIAKQWLPASMNNGTSMAKYRDTSAVKTSSRATNNNDQKPFSYSQYDNTPLNRLTKHYGAGEVWQNPEIDKFTGTDRYSNEATGFLSCNHYSYQEV